jgi:3-oxoacyl-[acyl-carrier-protein] synthase-3
MVRQVLQVFDGQVRGNRKSHNRRKHVSQSIINKIHLHDNQCENSVKGKKNRLDEQDGFSAVKYAVAIGVYNMPAYLRKDDAFGYSIFADGAGAVVIGRSDSENSGYIGSQMLTDGTQFDFIGVYAGGTKMPVTTEVLEKNQQGLLSLQPMPGDRNVKLWPKVIEKLLDKYGLNISEVNHFIFTQINRSAITDVMEILGVPMSKTTTVMDKYGYTGSGCVPMAFHHAVAEGHIKRGDRVLFIASGAGLAVGSNLFIY